MLAKDIMSRQVMSVAADATVLEAATLLVKFNVSAMPVVDEQGILVGIVTEADLIPYAALQAEGKLGENFQRRLVTDVMTSPVVTIDEDTGLARIALLMAEKRIKRLPVQSGDSIVGMVSRVDVLRAMIPRAASDTARPALNAGNESLRQDVMAALSRESWAKAERFDVVSVDGAVYLWGIVPSVDVLRAYRVAAEAVPGVKAVVQHMQVAQQG